MHDAPFMEVGNALEKVNHDDLGLLKAGKATLLKIPIEGERVEFQDDIGGVFRFEDGVELTNIFVVELCQDLELFHE
jgi:hypothetical protein